MLVFVLFVSFSSSTSSNPTQIFQSPHHRYHDPSHSSISTTASIAPIAPAVVLIATTHHHTAMASPLMTSNGLIGTELGGIGKDGRRPGMLEHGIDDEVTVVVCKATSPLFCNLSLDSLIRITDLDCQLLVSTSFNIKPAHGLSWKLVNTSNETDMEVRIEARLLYSKTWKPRKDIRGTRGRNG
ncbi:hypothetical protein L1887_01347 [Cichorium endivia]|nr:hypothetical protein L1887_01347 [Cichorium endivia]